jgi:hypothetical protein
MTHFFDMILTSLSDNKHPDILAVRNVCYMSCYLGLSVPVSCKSTNNGIHAICLIILDNNIFSVLFAKGSRRS